jgi:hypothetical protein
MILRLTPKTGALVGETPAEWQLPLGNGAHALRRIGPELRRQFPQGQAHQRGSRLQRPIVV